MVSKFLNMCFLSFCNPGPNIFEFILSCYCVGVLTHCSIVLADVNSPCFGT